MIAAGPGRKARMLRRLAMVLSVLTLLGCGITWVALESGEVVVLRTRDAQGVRETRVWIADDGPFAWLEAATPEREWYLRLLADPRLEGGRRRTSENGY